MRYLLNTLKEHFKTDFDRLSVLLVFLFTAIFVVLQYRFQWVSTPIKAFVHWQRIPLYWLLYTVIFSASCGILYWRRQIPNVFANPYFWATATIL